MKHVLRISVPEEYPEVPITAEDFQALRVAREVLSNALALEQKYEIIRGNYIQFEKRCLEISCDRMTCFDNSYSGFFGIQLDLNICLVNLLTSTRLYTDGLAPHVKVCISADQDAANKVKVLLREQYDRNLNYRFMEALRNYVQHRGLPVHFTQHGSKWTSLEDDGLLEYSIYVASDRAKLEEDPKFKKPVLKDFGERIDLVHTTRCYVESISNIHESIRNLVASSVSAARSEIESMHSRYTQVYKGDLTGLAAEVWSDGQLQSSLPLLLDWDDIRINLQERNPKLTNLSKRYVTNRRRDDA